MISCGENGETKTIELKIIVKEKTTNTTTRTPTPQPSTRISKPVYTTQSTNTTTSGAIAEYRDYMILSIILIASIILATLMIVGRHK